MKQSSPEAILAVFRAHLAAHPDWPPSKREAMQSQINLKTHATRIHYGHYHRQLSCWRRPTGGLLNIPMRSRFSTREWRGDDGFFSSGQIFREHLVVSTRPINQNGLGLLPSEAFGNVIANATPRP